LNIKNACAGSIYIVKKVCFDSKFHQVKVLYISM
jgi:hypothetical protein